MRLSKTLLGFRRCLLLVTVLLATAASAGVESAYGAWTAVARWEMNEGADAPMMIDSEGSRDGTIGDEVVTGVNEDGATGYRWPGPDPGVRDAERLVEVEGGLNPGRRAYAVTVRFKTTDNNFNIIQKGQAGTMGGMWKLEMEGGRATCLFKGSAGRGAIGSAQSLTLTNGEWHTIRCERLRRSVRIIVDDHAPRSQARRTGRIANGFPVVIGGKSSCNPPETSCEYYVGMLDRVVIRRKT
jgi:Laminin G domain